MYAAAVLLLRFLCCFHISAITFSDTGIIILVVAVLLTNIDKNHEGSMNPISILYTAHKQSLGPVSTSRVDGPSTRLVETRARQHGPCWRVMETGHPLTRAVNSGIVETEL